MSNNTEPKVFIIIGNQIAGPVTMQKPLHRDYQFGNGVQYELDMKAYEQYIESLPRYDIPPSLQKEWEGRTEVEEDKDFMFMDTANGKVIFPYASGSSKQGIEELKAITSGHWDKFNTNEEINEELGREAPDEFIEKHLNKIKELTMKAADSYVNQDKEGAKTIDSLISKHLNFHPTELRMSSVKHYVETGALSGSFRLALAEMFQEVLKENAALKEEKEALELQLEEKQKHCSEWAAKAMEIGQHHQEARKALVELERNYVVLGEINKGLEETVSKSNENDELRKPGGNEMWINQNVVQPQKEKIKELESSLFVLKAKLSALPDEVYVPATIMERDVKFLRGWGWLKKINLKDLPGQQNDAAIIDLLDEARVQLEYLNNKFPATGTTANILSRIETFLEGRTL